VAKRKKNAVKKKRRKKNVAKKRKSPVVSNSSKPIDRPILTLGNTNVFNQFSFFACVGHRFYPETHGEYTKQSSHNAPLFLFCVFISFFFQEFMQNV